MHVHWRVQRNAGAWVNGVCSGSIRVQGHKQAFRRAIQQGNRMKVIRRPMSFL